MIRQATPEDLERIVEMGVRFINETSYVKFLSPSVESITMSVVNLMANPNAILLVSGSDATVTGMIGMLSFDHPFSGERVASEMFWWVDPEARGDGIRLLVAAEKWAKEAGAVKVQMVAPNERVGEIYERLSYTPVETMYQRAL